MVQIGFIGSVLLHLALLGWAMWGLLATSALKGPEPQAISVTILTPSDLLRLKQGSETSKHLVAKPKDNPKPSVSKLEAKKPKPVTAPTPPDPIAEKLAKLPPVKSEADKKKEADAKKRAEDKKQAEAKKIANLKQKKAEDAKKKAADKKRKAAEAKRKKKLAKKRAEKKRKREAAKKKAATADRLAALLNKDPTKRGAPQSAVPSDEETDFQGPTAGTRTGTDTVLSAREQDLLRGMLKSQIAPCWRLPGGGGGTETPVVELRWRLRPDGSLQGEPQVTRAGSGTFGRLANEAAVRAVKSCQPFQLPPDMYQAWKDIIWEFDPSQML